MNRFVASLIVLSILRPAGGSEPKPPVTTLVEPQSLVSAERFDRPEAFGAKRGAGASGWIGGIGEWSVRDSAAYAVQEGPSAKRPNGHEAVCEHVTDLGDILFTAEFKLGTSPQIGFVCRDTQIPNHHLGRVVVTPTAIWIQKMSGIAKETRREELKKIEVVVDPDAWHRVTVEIRGDRYLARIDEHELEARHARFADRKGRIGFVARGEGAQFRNVALWSAKAKP